MSYNTGFYSTILTHTILRFAILRPVYMPSNLRVHGGLRAARLQNMGDKEATFQDDDGQALCSLWA